MKNVLIVCGGKSYEHEISVVTASQIYARTKLSDVNLKILYISQDNRYFIYLNSKIDIGDFSKNKFSETSKNFKEIFFVSSEKKKLFIRSMFGLKEYMTADIAIICCHGGAGEDGRLISFFEQMGISCSSGNFDSLAVCMNKFLFKQTMKGLGIPVVRGFKINKQAFESDKEKILLKLRLMKYPVVLKPNSGGSSIGLFVVESQEDFICKINEVFEFEDDVMIEKFISNAREFNVAVIGEFCDYQVSEIDEPIKVSDVLTFADKYLSGGKNKAGMKLDGKSMASAPRNIPANIDESLTDKIKSLTGKIFRELKLVGVVRIDFLYDSQKEKIYVCEVNSVPGSLAYYFFNNGKFLLNEYVLKLIEIAEKNKNSDDRIHLEFVTEIL